MLTTNTPRTRLARSRRFQVFALLVPLLTLGEICPQKQFTVDEHYDPQNAEDTGEYLNGGAPTVTADDGGGPQPHDMIGHVRTEWVTIDGNTGLAEGELSFIFASDDFFLYGGKWSPDPALPMSATTMQRDTGNPSQANLELTMLYAVEFDDGEVVYSQFPLTFDDDVTEFWPNSFFSVFGTIPLFTQPQGGSFTGKTLKGASPNNLDSTQSVADGDYYTFSTWGSGIPTATRYALINGEHTVTATSTVIAKMLDVRGVLNTSANISTDFLYINGFLVMTGSANTVTTKMMVLDEHADMDFGVGTDRKLVTLNGRLAYGGGGGGGGDCCGGSGGGGGFRWDIAGVGDHDRLNVTGKVRIYDWSRITLRASSGGTFNVGDQYPILTAPQIDGEFGGFLGQQINSDLKFNIVYDRQSNPNAVLAEVLAVEPGPPLVPVNAARQVNETTAGHQDQPVAVFDDNGDFVISYREQGGSAIRARWYNSDATALSGETTINASAGTYANPAVAYRNGVTAFAYDKDGAGVVLRVSNVPPTISTGEVTVFADPSATRPTVRIDSTGRHLVTAYVADPGPQYTIKGQWFDSNAAPDGGPFDISASQTLPANGRISVTLRVTDDFDAIWAAGTEVRGRRFNSAGVALTDEVTLPFSVQVKDPSADLLDNGNLVVVANTLPTVGVPYSVRVAVVDEFFNAVGTDRVINVAPTIDASGAGVASIGGNRAAVTFRGCDFRLRVRAVDANGVPDSAEIVISNTLPVVDAGPPAAAASGQVLIPHTLDGLDGDGLGTYFLYLDKVEPLSFGDDGLYALDINIPAGSVQKNVDTFGDPDGDFFAVTWQLDDSGAVDDVVQACFVTDSTASNGCVPVNVDSTPGHQSHPSIGGDRLLEQVIAWARGDDVRSRFADANGLSGSPFTVSLTPTGGNAKPKVVVDSLTDSVWYLWDRTTSPYLVGRKYQYSTQTPLTGEVDLGAQNPLDSHQLTLIGTDLWAAWSEETVAGSQWDMKIRRYDVSLAAIEPVISVSTSPNPRNPDISCDENDSCLLLYDADQASDRKIYRLSFDAATGQPTTTEDLLDPDSGADGIDPSVSRRDNGEWVVMWRCTDPDLTENVCLIYQQPGKDASRVFRANATDIGTTYPSVGKWTSSLYTSCWSELGPQATAVTCRSWAPPPEDTDDDDSPDVCDSCPGFDDNADQDDDDVPDGCDDCDNTAPGTPVMANGCSGDLTAYGRAHAKLGNAVLDAQAGDCEVGVYNLGNSGGDGVTVNIKNDDAENLAFTVQISLSSTTLNPGQVLANFIGGKLSGIPQLLGKLVARNNGTGVLILEADYTYLSVPNVRVEVFNDGQPVGSPMVMAAGDIGTVPTTAEINGFGTFAVTTWGQRIFFRTPVAFAPTGGGGPLVGNEIRVYAHGFSGNITEVANFDFIGINVGSLSICDETLGNLQCAGYPSNEDDDGDGVVDGCDDCVWTIPGASVDADGCPPLIPGDADRDGDVDDNDVAEYKSCAALSGPSVIQPVPYCLRYDYNGDACNDHDDFGAIQVCYSGENNPADVSCAPLQACCLPNGSCLELRAEECKAASGWPQGRGTDCGSATCYPTGACCPSGFGSVSECYQTYPFTYSCLPSDGGEYQGNGTTCQSVICPDFDKIVICCLSGGECRDDLLTKAQCEAFGGTSKGNARPEYGWGCDDVACPQPPP